MLAWNVKPGYLNLKTLKTKEEKLNELFKLLNNSEDAKNICP
jgi:hypothetical protein